MAVTANNGLPLIDTTMTADVPRDMNALANAIDAAYTAANILSKLLTVDTDGSGLNASTLKGIDISRIIYGADLRGSTGMAGLSLDTILKSGFYHAYGDTINRPLAANGHVIHSQAPGDDAFATQLYLTSSSDRIFFRRKASGVWASWVEITLNSIDNMFTASQTIKNGSPSVKLFDTDSNNQVWLMHDANAAYLQHRDSAGVFVKNLMVLANDGSSQLMDGKQVSFLTDYIRQPGYGTTAGSANTYTLTLSPALAAYAAGVCVSVKINVANTGASTINVNGLGAKAILDSKGAALIANKLRLDVVYTLRYNGTSFILQGEGGDYGTAVASEVLATKTIGTDAGIVTGTMVNRSGSSPTATSTGAPGGGNLDFQVPVGYYDGATSLRANDADFIAPNFRADKNVYGLQGSMPVRAGAHTAAASVDGTSVVGRLYMKPTEGYYDQGAGTWAYFDDPDYIAANLRKDTNVLGLTGTLQPDYRTLPVFATSGDGFRFFHYTPNNYSEAWLLTKDGYMTRIVQEYVGGFYDIWLYKYNLSWGLVSSVKIVNGFIGSPLFFELFQNNFLVHGGMPANQGQSGFAARIYNYSGTLLSTKSDKWGAQNGTQYSNYSSAYNPTRDVFAYGGGFDLIVYNNQGTLIASLAVPSGYTLAMNWYDGDTLFIGTTEENGNIYRYTYGVGLDKYIQAGSGSTFGYGRAWYTKMLNTLGFNKF